MSEKFACVFFVSLVVLSGFLVVMGMQYYTLKELTSVKEDIGIIPNRGNGVSDMLKVKMSKYTLRSNFNMLSCVNAQRRSCFEALLCVIRTC